MKELPTPNWVVVFFRVCLYLGHIPQFLGFIPAGLVLRYGTGVNFSGATPWLFKNECDAKIKVFTKI